MAFILCPIVAYGTIQMQYPTCHLQVLACLVLTSLYTVQITHNLNDAHVSHALCRACHMHVLCMSHMWLFILWLFILWLHMCAKFLIDTQVHAHTLFLHELAITCSFSPQVNTNTVTRTLYTHIDCSLLFYLTNFTTNP